MPDVRHGMKRIISLFPVKQAPRVLKRLAGWHALPILPCFPLRFNKGCHNYFCFSSATDRQIFDLANEGGREKSAATAENSHIFTSIRHSENGIGSAGGRAEGREGDWERERDRAPSRPTLPALLAAAYYSSGTARSLPKGGRGRHAVAAASLRPSYWPLFEVLHVHPVLLIFIRLN